ncbi:hypothetical protein [Aquimarina sp. AU474]|uniref:hypothetical protein n=1 Tax=Aquimarina sp. AU474 TaxID=2108529 RepID=UPI000D695189|nr:hypothetical protein [Aquimarina sp. AU474]
MKNVLIIAFLSVLTTYGQETSTSVPNTIHVGDVLTLGNPSAQIFEYVHFPKTNFIIKKGGVPNYKNLQGKKVIVTKVEEINNGKVITLKRKDGLKFFNSIPKVRANLEQALAAGEVKF